MSVPIALYNSEVWGTMCFKSKPDNIQLFSESGFTVNSLQYTFLRIILGVSKHSSKLAILTETGQLPLITKVISSMINFLFHMIQSKSPILRNSLKMSADLNDMGVNSWFSIVKKIMELLGIEHILYTNDNYEVDYHMRNIKRTIKSKFMQYWRQELLLKSEGKLGFYKQYTNKFELQGYFSCTSLCERLRKVYTRFRIGAHKLPVETGRYYNILREDRFCPLCCDGVGNEKHYLTICNNPIIVSLRDSFYKKIGNGDPLFLSLSDERKINVLMTSNDHNTLTQLGFFLEKIEGIFKESYSLVQSTIDK